MSSDEKLFRVDGYTNPQNQGVRETSAKHVPAKPKSKFPAGRMVWLGSTGRGTTKLHVVPQGTNIDKDYYLDKILRDRLKISSERGDWKILR